MKTLQHVMVLNRSVKIIYLVTLINRLGTFVFPFLSLYLVNRRGFSVAEVGGVLAIGSIGIALGNVVSGHLVDRWNMKATLMVALFLNMLGYLLLMVNWTWMAAYPIALFVGLLGMGMVGPAANAFIVALTNEENRSFSFTVQYVMTNVGMAIGPLLGGIIIDYSYTALFFGDVISTAICMVLIMSQLTNVSRLTSTKQHTRPGVPVSILHHLRQYSHVWMFCGAGFFLIAPLFALEYLVPLIVKNVFNMQSYWIGLIYSSNCIIVLVCSFRMEKWMNRYEAVQLMIIAACIWFSGISCMWLGFSTIWIIFGTVLWTFGEIIYFVAMPTYLSKQSTDTTRGRFMALNEGIVTGSRITMPLFFGMVLQIAGAKQAFFVMLSFPVMAMLGFLITRALVPSPIQKLPACIDIRTMGMVPPIAQEISSTATED